MIDFIIQYWLGMVFLGIVSIGSFVVRHYNKKIKRSLCEYDAIKLGLQALLRTEIIKNYNIYKVKGHCHIYEKDSTTAMGKAYHLLGGNGTTAKLLEEIDEMPTDIKYVKQD